MIVGRHTCPGSSSCIWPTELWTSSHQFLFLSAAVVAVVAAAAVAVNRWKAVN